MPSGPKKRRAAKRRNEEKEKAKQTNVSVKLAKGSDLHEVKKTIEEVSDNSIAIQENNKVPLLDVTSNEDILVSNDEPVLSKNAGCIMESVESGEILQGNEYCGVETEQLTSAPEQMFELLSDDMTPQKMLERDVPVVVPAEATDVEEDIVGKRGIGGAANVFKDVFVMGTVIEANEESLLNATTINEVQEMAEDVKIVSQNSSCIIESVESGESVIASEIKKDTTPLVSVNVMSNESIKEAENTSLIHDQSTLAAEGMKDAAQLVSGKDTEIILPRVGLPVVLPQPSSNELLKEDDASSDSKEMQPLPTETVSPATENQVTEIQSASYVMQAVLEGTVSPVTENQVYFACPMHCNAECSFSQLLRDQLIENVVELKSAIHSLKEDLVKALDKLDSISY